MNCSKCNFDNEEGRLFCKKCGTKLDLIIKPNKPKNNINKNNDDNKIVDDNTNVFEKILKLKIAVIPILAILGVVIVVLFLFIKNNVLVHKFEYVNESNKQDYSICTNLNAFDMYEDKKMGISFAYPKYIYNYVETKRDGYYFRANDGSELHFIVKKRNKHKDMREEMENEYSKLEKNYENFNEIVFNFNEEKSFGKFVVSGKTNSDDIEKYHYFLYNIYPEKIEVFYMVYPLESDWDYKYYVLDTVYRYCSYSGSSYLPRTYEQFKNDDLGEKKQ